MPKASRIDFLEKSFFHDNPLAENKDAAKLSNLPISNRFLALVRIPKTATSSLFALMNDVDGPNRDCFFGTAMLSGSDDTPQHFPEEYYTPVDTRQCEHRAYSDSLQFWGERLLPEVQQHRLDLPAMSSPTQKQQQSMFSLETIAIVRDPLERLVSQFVYMQRIYPHWSGSLRQDQVQALLADNLPAFASSLGQYGPADHPQIFFQHRMFLNQPSMVEQSIELLQGDNPRIFTVVQECFDVSLYMLAERYPEFIPKHRVQAFIHAKSDDDKVQNKGYESMTAASRLSEQMRSVAMQQWWADDYRFYRAAVHQFQMHLYQATDDSIPPAMRQECLATLERQKAERQRVLSRWQPPQYPQYVLHDSFYPYHYNY